jgi:hypothetical protein
VGTFITVDAWLLDLAAKSAREASVARTLATTQHRVSRDLGHVLALNDEFVRRRISEKARVGRLPTISVRCVRCPAVAALGDWVKVAGMAEHQRFAWFEHIAKTYGHKRGDFLKPCLGDLQAARTLDAIEHMEWEANR